MKYLVVFAGVASLVLLSCTKVEFDNPYDPEASNYIDLRLIGDDPLVLSVGEEFLDPGASASSEVEGNLTDRIVRSGDVSTDFTGTYTITYAVTDRDGNRVTARRIVHVVPESDRDVIPPTITLNGADPYVIPVDGVYEDPGATATDNVDGDVTGRVAVDPGDLDPTRGGTYTVTYTVADLAGNEASRVRTVVVMTGGFADTVAPVISLMGRDTMLVDAGGGFRDPGATAVDETDGNISDSIKIEGTVDTWSAGLYTVVYSVRDRAGNSATVERMVRVVGTPTVDTAPPAISLMGSNPQVVWKNGSYIEAGATATDNVDGDLTNAIVIDASGVNPALVGTWHVVYSVSDQAGNVAEVRRSVKVQEAAEGDTVPPVIALRGDNPLSIRTGEDYVEAGATALDNVDLDLTSAITVDASEVNTGVAGTYRVIYTVSDRAGNTATTQRSVKVQGVSADTVPPVLTLRGANPITLTVGEAYTEPGASALDNIDGVLDAMINIDSSSVAVDKPGTYTVVYTVSDAAANVARATRTVTVLASSGDLLGRYGVPGDAPLPKLDNLAFQSIAVEGQGGPTLPNVTRFTINWDLANQSLHVFAFNTSDGRPDWYVPMHGKLIHTFAQAGPRFTLSGSGFAGLDGDYYIKTTAGGGLVWVRTDGSFAVVFAP